MSSAYNEFRKLIDGKRYQEAARYAEQEHLRGPEGNAFWLTQKAGALRKASDYKGALDTAREALRVDPGDRFAVAAVADVLLAQGNAQEALPYYEELLDLPKLSSRARHGVLNCLTRQKDWDRLLETVSQWDLPEAEALRFRVKALAAGGSLEQALAACSRWLELKPHHPPALWERTEIEIQRDGLDSVLDRFGRTARIPSLPPVYKEIYASLCRRAGKADLAMEQYSKIEAGGADFRIQSKQAFLLANSGREQEAIGIMEELLRLAPKDKYLHSSYGAACARIDQVERAINFYNTLLGLYPEEKALYGRIKGLKRKLEDRA